MSKIGSYQNFDYIFYDSKDAMLLDEYVRMFNIHKLSGHSLKSVADVDSIDGGILLQSAGNAIAGIWYDLGEHKKEIQIVLAFVEHEYRQTGIYKQLHGYMNDIARQKNKTGIYSFIKLNNSFMLENIVPNIGYIPVAQLVYRSVDD